jgi:hypothetical protein
VRSSFLITAATIGGLVFAAFVTLKDGKVRGSASTGSPVVPAITYEMYQKIKPGMTYDQVITIAGSEGREEGSYLSGGEVHRIQTWQRRGRWFMSAAFKNNHLTSKNEWRLP